METINFHLGTSIRIFHPLLTKPNQTWIHKSTDCSPLTLRLLIVNYIIFAAINCFRCNDHMEFHTCMKKKKKTFDQPFHSTLYIDATKRAKTISHFKCSNESVRARARMNKSFKLKDRNEKKKKKIKPIVQSICFNRKLAGRWICAAAFINMCALKAIKIEIDIESVWAKMYNVIKYDGFLCNASISRFV